MLTAASARLTHPVAALAVERIRLFHSARFLARPRLPEGVTLFKLNDAIVAGVDIEVAKPPSLRLHDDPYHDVGYDEVGPTRRGNMAFAFAYKAEEAGSAKGLTDDHLYTQLRPYDRITSTLNISALEERVPIPIQALGRRVEFFCCPRKPKPGTGVMARLFSDQTMTDLAGDPLPPAA